VVFIYVFYFVKEYDTQCSKYIIMGRLPYTFIWKYENIILILPLVILKSLKNIMFLKKGCHSFRDSGDPYRSRCTMDSQGIWHEHNSTQWVTHIISTILGLCLIILKCFWNNMLTNFKHTTKIISINMYNCKPNTLKKTNIEWVVN